MDKHAFTTRNRSEDIVQLVSKYPKIFFNKPNYQVRKNKVISTAPYYDYPVVAEYDFTAPDISGGLCT